MLRTQNLLTKRWRRHSPLSPQLQAQQLVVSHVLSVDGEMIKLIQSATI